jgi:hypothetical protein
MKIAFADIEKDAKDLFDDLKRAKTDKDLREIFKTFIEKNGRDRSIPVIVGSTSEFAAKEGRKGQIRVNEPMYYASAQMARVLSELNEGLRNNITEGKNKKGMDKMSADRFEKEDIKSSVEDFLNKELMSNDLKANDALLKIRYGGFNPEKTAELMRRLSDSYYFASKDEILKLGQIIRTVNLSLTSEYQELRGKLDSQETFRNVNALE